MKKKPSADEFQSLISVYDEKLKLIIEHEEKMTLLIERLEKVIESRPKYITGLIDEGYLMPDGKTTNVGLGRIAEYLYTHIENVTPEILLQFRQKNGLPFTKRTAKAAATSCKLQ